MNIPEGLKAVYEKAKPYVVLGLLAIALAEAAVIAKINNRIDALQSAISPKTWCSADLELSPEKNTLIADAPDLSTQAYLGNLYTYIGNDWAGLDYEGDNTWKVNADQANQIMGDADAHVNFGWSSDTCPPGSVIAK